ncbi:purine/pyrimidine permease [Bacillus velezensis]
MFDSGLIITSLFITVLLIVNMLASIRVVEAAVKNSAAPLGNGVSVRQGLRLRSATF